MVGSILFFFFSYGQILCISIRFALHRSIHSARINFIVQTNYCLTLLSPSICAPPWIPTMILAVRRAARFWLFQAIHTKYHNNYIFHNRQSRASANGKNICIPWRFCVMWLNVSYHFLSISFLIFWNDGWLLLGLGISEWFIRAMASMRPISLYHVRSDNKLNCTYSVSWVVLKIAWLVLIWEFIFNLHILSNRLLQFELNSVASLLFEVCLWNYFPFHSAPRQILWNDGKSIFQRKLHDGRAHTFNNGYNCIQ